MYSLSQDRERIVLCAMSKRGQDTTSSDGSPVAKSQTHQSVATGQCKEDVSPQRLGSLVNLESVATSQCKEDVAPQRPGSLVNLEDEDDRKQSGLGLEKRSLKFPSEPTREG